MLFNAIALWPEISIPTANVNDDAEHIAFIERADDALQAGENIIDNWLPNIDLGFPEFFYYQHLPHVTVVALDRITFGTVDVFVLFNIVRWLLLVAFPLTVWWALRLMGATNVEAAVSAGAASLLSADHLYGFEYDSYVWRGLGLYTQIWAMHLSFIAIACLYRLLTRYRGLVSTVVALAVLALSHLIYAYMMVISSLVILAATATRARVGGQLLRLGAAGAAVLLITAYLWVPFVTQTGYLSTSPFLQPEKFTSYGAGTVLSWVVTGELFDHGRLPIFTLLAGIGVVASVVVRRRIGLLAVALLVVWLWFYSGRAALGPLFGLLPLHDSLLFHRFIGGVDIAGIMLIGIGGARVWDALLSPRLARVVRPWRLWSSAAAALGILIFLTPALVERSTYYGYQTGWLQQTHDAIDADTDLKTIFSTLRRLPPGRVYAGLASNWGRTLNFGLNFNSVHVYQLLTAEGFATVAPPFGGQSLNADLQFDFDDQRASQYDLYNARYVIAGPGVSLPSFLSKRAVTPAYVLYEAPTSGYAELVSLSGTESFRTQTTLFPAMRRFVNGPGPDDRTYARYDFPSGADAARGAPVTGCANGGSVAERAIGPSQLTFDMACPTASPAIVKVTYHPGWTVTVDGAQVATFMASPSYLGFMLPAGTHRVIASYGSAPIKAPLLVLGGATLAALAVLRRRGWVQ